MPRYLIERNFPKCLNVPATEAGAQAVQRIVARNADHGVTWVHSYVTEDRKKTFCIYDAPSPEAVRRAASDNDLPCDHITVARVLDPYFHIPAAEVAQ